MNIKEFIYITAIAEECNISKAAEKLFLSQPALSKFLKNLEEELSTDLFYRTSQGVSPTAAGEIFIDTARKIDRLYSEMQQRIQEKETQEDGLLRFGIPPAKSSIFLSKILKTAQSRTPGLTIDVVETDSDHLESMLMEGRIDAALISTPMVDNRIHCRIISREELLFAVSPAHPILALAQTENETGRNWLLPKDAASSPFILLRHGKLRRIFDAIFRSIGLSPDAQFVTNDTGVALAMARNGLGITLASETWVGSNDGLKYLSLSKNGAYRDIVMAYSLPTCSSKIMNIFTNLVADTINKSLGLDTASLTKGERF